MSAHVQVEPEVREQARFEKTRRRTLETALLALLLAVVATVVAGQSLSKPFWYDELITIRIAGLPTLGDIFRFHESGMETTSFLPGMLIHIAQHLPGLPELKLRLPFMAAYLVACWCMGLFVRRRYSIGYAAAALVFLPQGASLFYASETRAYAFVLMGTAIALAAWQAADREGRSGIATFGVFVGLATAILFHFFAIFLVVPFAFAEWMHQRITRRVRWGHVAGHPALSSGYRSYAARDAGCAPHLWQNFLVQTGVCGRDPLLRLFPGSGRAGLRVASASHCSSPSG